MDKKEKRNAILALLQQNARFSERAIAERLDTSAEDVAETIGELEREGAILGYYALVNEEKLGETGVSAIIEVAVQPERDGGFNRVAQTISKFPEVKTVLLVSGTHDLQLEVVGTSLQEVAGFVASKLAPLDGIKSTVTHFLLKRYKEAGFIFHEDETYERLKVVP